MRNPFRKLVLGSCIGLLAGLSLAQATAAEMVSDQEKGDIAQLLQITISDEMVDMVSDAMAKSLFDTPKPQVSKEDMVTLKAQAKIVLQAEFGKAGGLYDQVSDFYAQNFTDAEIQQLLAFYQSPLGKKMLTLMPETTKFVTVTMQQDLPVAIKAYRQRIAQCKPANPGDPLKCPD